MNLPSVPTKAEVEYKVAAMGTGVESAAKLGTATVVDSAIVTATVAGSAEVVEAAAVEEHRGDPTGVESTPSAVEEKSTPTS